MARIASKNFIRYYWKRILLAILALAMMAGMLAFAVDEEPYYGEMSGLLKSLKDAELEYLIGGSTVDDVADEVAITFTGDIKAGNLSVAIGDINLDTIGPILKGVNDVAILLATLMLFISFMLSMLGMREQEIIEEEVIKKLLFLGIGLALCFYAKDICMGIANIGSSVAKGVAKTTTEATDKIDTLDTINDYIDSMATPIPKDPKGIPEKLDAFGKGVGNSFNYLVWIIFFALPWLIAAGCRLAITLRIWGRAIEILLLAAFSPVAFSDIMDTNNISSSQGVRFVKNFAALALSGVFIIGSLAICRGLSASVLGSTVGAALVDGGKVSFTELAKLLSNLILISVVQVGMVSKANQLSKTVLGLA